VGVRRRLHAIWLIRASFLSVRKRQRHAEEFWQRGNRGVLVAEGRKEMDSFRERSASRRVFAGLVGAQTLAALEFFFARRIDDGHQMLQVDVVVDRFVAAGQRAVGL